MIIFQDTCNTMTGWVPVAGTLGSIASNGSSIYASSYGSGTNWHGPSVDKIVTITGDFDLSVNLTFSNNVSTIGSMGLYLLDDTGVIVGSVSISDSWAGSYTSSVYANSNINIFGEYDTPTFNGFNGIMRLKRTGATWQFYTNGVLKGTISNGNINNISKMRITFMQSDSYSVCSPMFINDITVDGTIVANNLKVNIDGVWKNGQSFVNIDGIWKSTSGVWTNVDGIWKKI